jgi:hypothetical protein
MAFGRFCLNYNDGLDMFCSKPAGHQNYNEADRNPEVRKHGYAGISWSG